MSSGIALSISPRSSASYRAGLARKTRTLHLAVEVTQKASLDFKPFLFIRCSNFSFSLSSLLSPSLEIHQHAELLLLTDSITIEDAYPCVCSACRSPCFWVQNPLGLLGQAGRVASSLTGLVVASLVSCCPVSCLCLVSSLNTGTLEGASLRALCGKFAMDV